MDPKFLDFAKDRDTVLSTVLKPKTIKDLNILYPKKYLLSRKSCYHKNKKVEFLKNLFTVR